MRQGGGRDCTHGCGKTAFVRPRVDLRIVHDKYLVVGLKLSDNEHTAVLSDTTGQVLASVSIAKDTPFADLGALQDHIKDMIDAICEKGGIEQSQIRAVGIGVPGFIKHRTGLLHWSPVI